MRAKKLADSKDSLLENYLASHLAFLSGYRMVSMKVDQMEKHLAENSAQDLEQRLVMLMVPWKADCWGQQ
jgi:hypothetical protein